MDKQSIKDLRKFSNRVIIIEKFLLGGKMHEMSLMSGVFDAIDSALVAYDYNKVIRVKLQVGKLTNAEPAALDFAFQAFAKGTRVEGANLEIEEIPVLGHCRECNLDFSIPGSDFRCSKCSSYSVEVVSGTELILESLEVEQ